MALRDKRDMERFDMLRKVTPLALCLFPLAACASASTEYPSLSVRDAERIEGQFNSPSTAPVAAQPALPSADLRDRLAQLKAEASTAHTAFLGAAPAATQKVDAARGTAIASDRWAIAQVALADLDSHRSKTAVALADLDILFTERAIALEQRGAVAETRETVTRMIAEEDAVLSRLRGELSQ
ncbi:hypothetical protein GRI94_08425 [Erythrobacter jejuensis]|uniref:DUF4398 domain-containing protein n=2 Tax=Parerythrobacter jejuensis TaxID=795812 RepID=A0A845AR26_9SPHN|nr:hypothetical protein [Parerythrobacter jejuensis]